MRLCILKIRASLLLLGLCNNCKYTVCARPKNLNFRSFVRYL